MGSISSRSATFAAPLEVVGHVGYRSTFGEAPPPQFGFNFTSLYGLSSVEKANIAASVATAVSAAEGAAPDAFRPSMVLKELKRSSEITGIFASITDENIKRAEAMEAEAPEIEAPAPEIEDVDPVSDPGHRRPEGEDGEDGDRKIFPLGRPQMVRADS